jgi:hypothetical protein
MRGLAITVLLVGAVALLACGGDDKTETQGAQQGNVSSLCGDLDTLNIAIVQAQALNPSTIAGANDGIVTSYPAVKREALSVPNVQMSQLDTAYNAYAQAVEAIFSLPPASQTQASLQSLKQPLDNLEAAAQSTAKQANCPPLATPVVPGQTPVVGSKP